jgi:hypothetical protein
MSAMYAGRTQSVLSAGGHAPPVRSFAADSPCSNAVRSITRTGSPFATDPSLGEADTTPCN